VTNGTYVTQPNSYFKFIVYCACSAALVLGSSGSFARDSDLDSTDPYHVLGVEPSATDHELTDAWKGLIKIHHPDYGGNDRDAQNLNEAYQFLKKNRADYDERIIPFRGDYKKSDVTAVVVAETPQSEDEKNYQVLYSIFLRNEQTARDLAGPNSENMRVFVFFAIMNLSGVRRNFGDFTSWQTDAYIDLVNHLDLFTLTKQEFTWVTLHDPAQALTGLMEFYDNFNIRFTTLVDLIRAQRFFYLTDKRSSLQFLSLFEGMASNRSLFEVRYSAFRKEILNTLKSWIRMYLDMPRSERRAYKDQYKRTRSLALRIEGFPKSIGTCTRLLLGVRPRLN
jgi:hypothetical protein